MDEISRLKGQINALAVLYEIVLSNEMAKWGEQSSKEFVSGMLSLDIEGGINEDQKSEAEATYEMLHSVLTRSFERAKILGFESEA